MAALAHKHFQSNKIGRALKLGPPESHFRNACKGWDYASSQFKAEAISHDFIEEDAKRLRFRLDYIKRLRFSLRENQG
jgi:hypothetical protein